MAALMKDIRERVAPGDGGEERKRVLICLGRYLPGNKDGGPIRSIGNMVAHLSAYFDFYVLTADRDAEDTERYPDVTPDQWHLVGRGWVLYCSSFGPGIIRRAFREVKPDVVVLNSFHDVLTRTALLLRRVGLFGKTPVLLAPRGEFSAGAMQIKQTKKDFYRRATKLLGLNANLLWLVSTPREKLELLEAAPTKRLDPDSIYVAYNITDAVASTAAHAAKQPGSVKLAFIARMSEMKNLDFLLGTLRDVTGNVCVNLFGPIAEMDTPYWEKCKALMAQLPGNITVQYNGFLHHSAVPQVLHDHHFFVLPTRGENFCHAAAESFVNGTPVILSDATPWIGLAEVYAGFDISLKDHNKWATTLQECVDMDQQTYALYLQGASEYGGRFSAAEAVKQHLAMFGAAFSGANKGSVRQLSPGPSPSECK